MKELNLIGAEIKDIEDFVFDAVKDNVSITLETGEYGMVFFQKMVRNEAKQQDFTSIETLETMKNTQSVKYLIANGREVVLLHNSELDNREVYPAIDKETGFPIKSSTLYLKE